MGFSFYEPKYLLLLLMLVPALWLYKKYWEKKQAVYLKFSGGMFFKRQSRIKMHLPFALVLLSAIMLVIALADPHIPWKVAKKGVNVVLVIDDSGSMAATDYKPTRLEAAKRAAEILIKSLKPKDYVGIVIFESGATTACYLTPDKKRALEKLKAIKQREGATALGDGLMLGVDMASSIPNRQKVVILLSDGVNNAGVVSPQEAVEYAKEEHVQVFTVGMGSEKPVVLGYNWAGQPVYAELDEKTLKWIAQETGGKYYKSVNEKTLEDIYKRISKDIKREWEDISIKNVFVWIALILLLLDIYLVYFKYKLIA